MRAEPAWPCGFRGAKGLLDISKDPQQKTQRHQHPAYICGDHSRIPMTEGSTVLARSRPSFSRSFLLAKKKKEGICSHKSQGSSSRDDLLVEITGRLCPHLFWL